MNKAKFFTLCRILCIVLCSVFLFSACSDDPGARLISEYEQGDNPNQEGGSEEALNAAQSSCWQGSLITLMYGSFNEMSLKVFERLTGEKLIEIMVLAFTVWMAFQILRHVATPTPESMGEFWTKIIRKGALCFVCGLLVSTPENIFYTINSFIMPIYNTMLEFSDRILQNLGQSGEAEIKNYLKFPDFDKDQAICEAFVNQTSSCHYNNAAASVNSTTISDAPAKLMECMTCAVSDHLNIGFHIAYYLLSIATIPAGLTAIFLAVCFLIAKLGFVVYILDSIVRFDVMLIIIPFLIMFYPFEQTRKWTILGFKVMLSSAGIMMCLGILISMSIYAMVTLLRDPMIYNTAGNPDAYKTFGVTALSLIFIGFLILKSSGMAISLTETIVGYGGSPNLQKNLAKIVSTVASAVFAIVTMGAGTTVTAAMKYAEKLRQIAKKVRAVRAQVNYAAGRQQNPKNSEGE